MPTTAFASPTWWRGSGRAPSTGCAASRTGCAISCRTAARRRRASCGSSPIRRRRWPRSPRSRARPSIAASSPRRWTATPGRPAARLRRNDLAEHKADWVDPIGLTYRGMTLHEIPPSGQGIAACMALGILENFDVAGHDADGPEVAHLKIEAMKLAFADIWRYVADPRFMDVTPAQMLDKHYLKSRAKLIDPKKAKEFGPGVPEGRRHDLSRHGRRVGHDGVADPVELHGLRLGHRGAGHRHRSPEPRERVRDDQGPCQRGRSEEAAVPHHHPRLHHQGRQAGRDLRPDGRRHAAAGPHAGLLAHRRLRPAIRRPPSTPRAGACTRATRRCGSRSTCRPTR